MSMKQAVTLALMIALSGPALAQEVVKPVKLVTAQGGGKDVQRQFFGHVVAKETVDLAFQVGGQLQKFPIIEGQMLNKGDLVAQLDLESFELAKRQAELQRNQSERTLKRLQQLSGRTVSQVNIDDAATQLGLSEVAVGNAEFALKHATILAPFDAMVATRNVANFSTISSGTPVVRLHDMSELRIEVDIPEVLFLRAESQPDVQIHARFPSSDQLFPLEFREFEAETSKVGQSYRVTLGMQPSEDVRILPGASVTVIASLKSEHQDAILLPKTAVFVDTDGNPAVMVFTSEGAESGKVHAQPVTVAPVQGEGILVTSGLDIGREVVATGGAALSDGQSVRRFTGFGS